MPTRETFTSDEDVDLKILRHIRIDDIHTPPHTHTHTHRTNRICAERNTHFLIECSCSFRYRTDVVAMRCATMRKHCDMLLDVVKSYLSSRRKNKESGEEWERASSHSSKVVERVDSQNARWFVATHSLPANSSTWILCFVILCDCMKYQLQHDSPLLPAISAYMHRRESICAIICCDKWENGKTTNSHSHTGYPFIRTLLHGVFAEK